MTTYFASILILVTFEDQFLLQLLGVTTSQLTAASGQALMFAAVPMASENMIMEAGSQNEALEMAKCCPNLTSGGEVPVFETIEVG